MREMSDIMQKINKVNIDLIQLNDEIAELYSRKKTLEQQLKMLYEHDLKELTRKGEVIPMMGDDK